MVLIDICLFLSPFSGPGIHNLGVCCNPAMSNLGAVEGQRLLLERNVEKLRSALQHWRTWDAEYEGLKEELLSLIHI